ncbi:MAG TPA: universal stress protein [Longimicrobium sp.]|nr:universal stress protein [Longimicrobium sp.]
MPERIPRIVAGIGELVPGDPTLLAAAGLASACGAELHLVHAYQIPTWMTAPPGLEAAYPEATTQYREMLMAALHSAARAHPGGEQARLHVLPGPAGAVLSELARDLHADLLVVGAARGSRVGRAILGTTAQRVLRHATVPVLVARRPAAAPPRRMLLTGDLSALSGAVHDRALETIQHLLGNPQALRSLVVVGWTLPPPPPLTPDAITRAARAELWSFLHQRPQAGPPAEPVVRTGIVSDEIVDEARDWGADLVVVGTHARGWGQRLMLGSVAEATLRDAPCNVLAIPPLATALPAAVPDAAAHREVPELAGTAA